MSPVRCLWPLFALTGTVIPFPENFVPPNIDGSRESENCEINAVGSRGCYLVRIARRNDRSGGDEKG